MRIIKISQKINQPSFFSLRILFTLLLISCELFLFFYFKDNGGDFTRVNDITIAQYMRINGSSQFMLAAYAQKIVFVSLFCYPILVLILCVKNDRPVIKNIKVNFFKLSRWSLILNLISFLGLLTYAVIVDNPSELIANPYGPLSIFYIFTPILWVVYLFSLLDLFFPFAALKELLQNEKLFAILMIILIALSTNPVISPIHLQSVIDFWSNLLLEPTITLALKISHMLGFSTQIFSFPGAPFPDFGTDKFHTTIAPECSGYEGITLATILLAGYCYLKRSIFHFPRSLLLIPIAILGMFFLNAIRLVILIFIGNFYSPELAFNGFHTVGGWFNLLIILVLSLWALNKFPFFLKKAALKPDDDNNQTAHAFLFPLMALVSTALIVKIFTVDFQWLYPVPMCVAACFIFRYREKFNGFLIRPSGLSIVIGILIFLIWIYLIPVDPTINLDFFKHLQSTSVVIALFWLLFRIIGAVAIVPIVEELAFRGYMLPHIRQWVNLFLLRDNYSKYLPVNVNIFGIIFSLASTSFIFGILHSTIFAGSIAGLGFGIAYLHRGKLIDAITAHAITNALLAVNVIWFGNWSYW
ncbi:exosortase E/protease, VPEID-CTERM system [Polynucleobacter sp. P1-05-14]|uniref:exosortase E/protease, VPEID-CTERM system n=1 Tax=Polynucleobacter sp. P1-05-14 TaxID=1819732 RepID=UPI001C0BF304|nr:exosortase E/protease, VPEID-CTERM system [Polynucleobacter sp. P1-05-14]MBU3548032.1 exosortase E/protease, VPEID-CTERM system [Polynucleobacter sp. P1-05-14]